jgi:hypothetical protein
MMWAIKLQYSIDHALNLAALISRVFLVKDKRRFPGALFDQSAREAKSSMRVTTTCYIDMSCFHFD